MKRICKICGKEFETKSSRRLMCYDDHYHACPVCGKKVLTKDFRHLNSCCSSECTRITKHKYAKHRCKICGSEFTPCMPNQQYCEREYHRSCVVCGKDFKVKSVSSKTKCCSSACSNALRKQSYAEKFGTDNPAKCDSVKEKTAKTNLERHGSTTPFTSPACIKKRKHTMLSFYGCEFAMQNDQLKKKQQESCFKSCGVKSPLSLLTAKSRLKDLRSNPSYVRDEAIKRATHRAKLVTSDGTHIDSSYELKVYEFLVAHNIGFSRQVPIRYFYENKQHTTLIDFEMNGQLVECKGHHLLCGVYDYAKGAVPISRKLQVYKDHNVILVADSESKEIVENAGLAFVDVKDLEPLLSILSVKD